MIQPPVLNVFNIEQSASTPNHVHKYCELLTESFTVPAINGQVTVLVAQSSQWQIGLWCWIQGAGFFRISGIPDSTHLYVINDGSQGTQAAGTVSPIGSIIIACPEQSLSVSTGSVALYDILTQPFTTPAVGSSADMYIQSINSWGAIGLTIYLAGAGWYTITAVDSVALKATVANAHANNLAAGQTVSVNAKVWPSPLPQESLRTGVLSAQAITASQTDTVLAAVVFTTAFKAIPAVSVSYKKLTAAIGASIQMYAGDVTVNGFNIYYTNGVTTGGLTVDVQWQAVLNGNS